MDGKSPLERAFELAVAGKCRTVSELRLELKKEGYPVEQLVGSSLTKQPVVLIREAQKNGRRT